MLAVIINSTLVSEKILYIVTSPSQPTTMEQEVTWLPSGRLAVGGGGFGWH